MLALVIFSVAVAFTFAACGGDDDAAAPAEPPAEGVPLPAVEPPPEPAPAAEEPPSPEPSPPAADEPATASPLESEENRGELRAAVDAAIAEHGWAVGCMATGLGVLTRFKDALLGLGSSDLALVGRSPAIIDPASDEPVWLGVANARGYAGPEVTELEEIEGDDYYCLQPPIP